MKLIRPFLLLAAFLGMLAATHTAKAADVRGILIAASNGQGETDRRLAAYEPTLRRILRFESYRFLGDGRATVEASDKGSISLGEGHELEIEAERSDGKAVSLKVRWLKGGRTLMNTGLQLRPGVPAVLGGPATGNKDEVYAVILVSR
jgi:hypothetical protein